MFSEITANQFQQKVLENTKPCVVDVYTKRCSKCKILAPIFKQTAEDNQATYDFFMLNAHDYIEITRRYKVLGVPALLFFCHGIVVDKKTGVISQDKIEKRLKPLLDYTEAIAKKKEVKGYFKLPWK